MSEREVLLIIGAEVLLAFALLALAVLGLDYLARRRKHKKDLEKMVGR